MTRKKLEEEKRKHLKKRPVMDTLDYQRYQHEMAEWDAKLAELIAAEKELDIRESREKMEKLALIASLEKRRSNRLEQMEILTKQYYRIGMRANRASDYKSRQYDIACRIVDLEAEINEFTVKIDQTVEDMMEQFNHGRY